MKNTEFKTKNSYISIKAAKYFEYIAYMVQLQKTFHTAIHGYMVIHIYIILFYCFQTLLVHQD